MNMDEQKMEHESDVEWGLRRCFLVAHQNRFGGNTNRLLCLASCFINIEMYGCRYPDEVMAEVRELTDEIADDIQAFRSSYSARKDVQFVKEGEPASQSGNYKHKYASFVKSGEMAGKPAPAPHTEKAPVPKVGGAGLMAGFVKSGDSFSSADTLGNEPSETAMAPPPSTQNSICQHPASERSSFQGSTFQSSTPQGSSPENSALVQSFFKLQSHIKSVQGKADNSISILHMAADMARMQLTCTFDYGKDGCICHLQINGIDIASSTGSTQKKISKNDAYEKALASLSKPYLQMNAENQLQASDLPFPGGSCMGPRRGAGSSSRGFSRGGRGSSVGSTRGTGSSSRGLSRGGRGSSMGLSRGGATRGNMPETMSQSGARGGRKRKQNVHDPRFGYNDFYILQPKFSQASHSILHTSSEFSKKPLDWAYNNEQGGVRCTVSLQGETLADVVDVSTAAAKKTASELALALLRERCWTFQVKQYTDSDEVGISRTEILGEEEKAQEALPTSNIGNKMMRLMGWSGGGIGKAEQGIAEPISVSTVINRAGLGMAASHGISKSFLPQIKATINEYAISEKEGDLAFSSEFTKEERALIHSECKKLNLKSVSRGRGEDRFLIVSRKRTTGQLFAMLQAAGGESPKYRLLAPGTFIAPLDDE